MKIKSLLLLFFAFLNGSVMSQFIFAELQGSPDMVTTNWNLTGAAYTGDTGGDTDNFGNELILTDAINSSSGAAFYSQSIDLGTCNQWNVKFDFRMFEGSAADGIAFCFLDVPPIGFVSGGGVGIPSTANGIKVILDTYNNCGGPNPGIQIYSGPGYNECIPGITSLDNVGGTLSFLRSSDYSTAEISYNYGEITVTINGTLYLTANYNVNFSGYMGFTASTGGSTDKHSVRDVTIYADIASADAGPDVSICSGETFQVGTANNSEFLYSWNTEINMNDSTLSDPSITLINSSPDPIIEEYIVTTILSSNPNSCPVQDTVQVTVNPIQETNLNEIICQGNTYNLGSTDYAVSGVYQEVFTDVNGCDSTVILDLTVLQELTSSLTDSICFGGAYDFGGIQYTESGVYTFNTQNMAGCDSTATLNLVVLPDLLFVLNESICSGSSYEFGGIQYDETGTYENIVLNTFGCDSTITLNLTVNPIQEFQYDFTICQGETYDFNGEVLTETGIYTSLIQSSEGCDSIVELNLTVYPTFSTSENFEICEGEEFLFEGQSFSSQGSYNFGLQSEFGCDSLVTINLTVTPTPEAPILTSNSPVSCFFEPVLIAMQEIPGAQYYWFNEYGYSSSLSSNEINLEEAYFTNYLSDNYSAYYIVNNCPSDTSVIEIGVEYGFEDFIFPNVITPNDDGINDELDIESLIPPCHGFNFKLYNRWGNLVFSQSKDVMTYESFSTTVNGLNFSGTTIRNRILDDGVYFYTLDLFHPPEMNSFLDLEIPDFNLFKPVDIQMNKSGYLHVIR